MHFLHGGHLCFVGERKKVRTGLSFQPAGLIGSIKFAETGTKATFIEANSSVSSLNDL